VRFAWNGSTWTTGVDDTPAYPLDIVDETAGGIQRNYGGTARLHYRHDKRTFSLVWPQVGTNAPQVYVRDMITSASTVELAYHGGTYTCYPVPGSLRCSETGYYVYDISAQFAEV
jgi:hypothetical protein